MTVFASRIPYFIQHIGLTTRRDIFVAFGAGHHLMLPVKLECRFIVVEEGDLPCLQSMTFQAIRGTVHVKLSKMLVLVALCTI